MALDIALLRTGKIQTMLLEHAVIGTIFFISGIITLVQTIAGDRLPIIQVLLLAQSHFSMPCCCLFDALREINAMQCDNKTRICLISLWNDSGWLVCLSDPHLCGDSANKETTGVAGRTRRHEPRAIPGDLSRAKSK